MARLYEYYDENHPPMKCFMTNARWYKESGKFTPRGILFHDTAADNPWLKRYVQPDDDAPDRAEMLALIGKNPYGNDRNHGAKDVASGLNAWIGKLADGRVTTLQTGPWDKRPWGCGSYKHGDKSYSLNDTHIQWEMCQDAKTNAAYFGDCYEESIQLSAYLCKKFNIDPKGTIVYNGITVPTIVCHWDSYSLKCGGNHSDIYDWTAMYDYLGIPENKVNINDPYNNPINLRIRDDIAKAMNRGPERDGWVKEDGKWYYYKDNVMLTSAWVKWRGDYYYVGEDGVMCVGWKQIEGKDYYFHETGICAQDEWIKKDNAYLFLGMDGAQTYRHRGSWYEDKKGKWFEDTSGWYATNRTVMIDGVSYRFNEKGYLNN